MHRKSSSSCRNQFADPTSVLGKSGFHLECLHPNVCKITFPTNCIRFFVVWGGRRGKFTAWSLQQIKGTNVYWHIDWNANVKTGKLGPFTVKISLIKASNSKYRVLVFAARAKVGYSLLFSVVKIGFTICEIFLTALERTLVGGGHESAHSIALLNLFTLFDVLLH